MFARTILSGVAALLFMSGAAFAASELKPKEIEGFIASLPDVKAMGDRLETEGKSIGFDDMAPKAGEPFSPYTRGVAHLKSVGEYGALGDIVKQHGFSSGENWAHAGDRVMAGYMAIKMEIENPDGAATMAAMDPAMIDQMPPEMRARFAGVMAMMETIKNVPDADRAALAPYIGELDAWMNSHGGRAPALHQ